MPVPQGLTAVAELTAGEVFRSSRCVQRQVGRPGGAQSWRAEQEEADQAAGGQRSRVHGALADDGRSKASRRAAGLGVHGVVPAAVWPVQALHNAGQEVIEGAGGSTRRRGTIGAIAAFASDCSASAGCQFQPRRRFAGRPPPFGPGGPRWPGHRGLGPGRSTDPAAPSALKAAQAGPQRRYAPRSSPAAPGPVREQHGPRTEAANGFLEGRRGCRCSWVRSSSAPAGRTGRPAPRRRPRACRFCSGPGQDAGPGKQVVIRPPRPRSSKQPSLSWSGDRTEIAT